MDFILVKFMKARAAFICKTFQTISALFLSSNFLKPAFTITFAGIFTPTKIFLSEIKYQVQAWYRRYCCMSGANHPRHAPSLDPPIRAFPVLFRTFLLCRVILIAADTIRGGRLIHKQGRMHPTIPCMKDACAKF